MKHIEIDITPSVRGSSIKIDGVEVNEVSRIKLEVEAIAGKDRSDISLEIDGYRMVDGELKVIELENHDFMLDQFSHRIKGLKCTVTISGEFNEYLFK